MITSCCEQWVSVQADYQRSDHGTDNIHGTRVEWSQGGSAESLYDPPPCGPAHGTWVPKTSKDKLMAQWCSLHSCCTALDAALYHELSVGHASIFSLTLYHKFTYSLPWIVSWPCQYLFTYSLPWIVSWPCQYLFTYSLPWIVSWPCQYLFTYSLP